MSKEGLFVCPKKSGMEFLEFMKETVKTAIASLEYSGDIIQLHHKEEEQLSNIQSQVVQNKAVKQWIPIFSSLIAICCHEQLS